MNHKNFKNRSLARCVAFQVLFQEDMNPGFAAEFGETFLGEELPDQDHDQEPLRVFARTLVNGTRLHQQEIDDQLTATATNWSISRMACSDRNVLRMAVFELRHMDTPHPVVVNEAIELAKAFGTKDSAAFVNGILGKLQKKKD